MTGRSIEDLALTERKPLPAGYALEFSQLEVGVHCPDGRAKWFDASSEAKEWAWRDSAGDMGVVV